MLALVILTPACNDGESFSGSGGKEKDPPETAEPSEPTPSEDAQPPEQDDEIETGDDDSSDLGDDDEIPPRMTSIQEGGMMIRSSDAIYVSYGFATKVEK